MSGLELVGLALAVVPLLISAAEHHRKASRPSHAALSRKFREKDLHGFAHELLDEVTFFHCTLKKFIENLPTLSEDEKQQILKLDKDLLLSKRTSDALEHWFSGPSKEAFEWGLRSVVKILDDLISEKTFMIEKNEKVCGPVLVEA
jgi:hypothetical protein